jgi:hypothetical protein
MSLLARWYTDNDVIERFLLTVEAKTNIALYAFIVKYAQVSSGDVGKAVL